MTQPCPNFLNQEESEAHGQVVICRDEFAAEYCHADVCGPCCVSVLRRLNFLNGQQQVADCTRDIEGNIPLQHCAARCRRRRAWTKWSFCRKTPLWVCGYDTAMSKLFEPRRKRGPRPGCDMSWWVCSGVLPRRRLRTLLRVRTPPPKLPKRAAAGCRLCQGHRRQHPAAALCSGVSPSTCMDEVKLLQEDASVSLWLWRTAMSKLFEPRRKRGPRPGCDMSWWVCSGVLPRRRLRTRLRVRTPPPKLPKRAAAGCRLCQGHRRQHPVAALCSAVSPSTCMDEVKLLQEDASVSLWLWHSHVQTFWTKKKARPTARLWYVVMSLQRSTATQTSADPAACPYSAA